MGNSVATKKRKHVENDNNEGRLARKPRGDKSSKLDHEPEPAFKETVKTTAKAADRDLVAECKAQYAKFAAKQSLMDEKTARVVSWAMEANIETVLNCDEKERKRYAKRPRRRQTDTVALGMYSHLPVPIRIGAFPSGRMDTLEMLPKGTVDMQLKHGKEVASQELLDAREEIFVRSVQGMLDTETTCGLEEMVKEAGVVRVVRQLRTHRMMLMTTEWELEEADIESNAPDFDWVSNCTLLVEGEEVEKQEVRFAK